MQTRFPRTIEMPIDPDQSTPADTESEPAPQRTLPAAAQRALAEAEARRKARDAKQQPAEKELGGRGGADPARYGDWEIDGRAIDF